MKWRLKFSASPIVLGHSGAPDQDCATGELQSTSKTAEEIPHCHQIICGMEGRPHPYPRWASEVNGSVAEL